MFNSIGLVAQKNFEYLDVVASSTDGPELAKLFGIRTRSGRCDAKVRQEPEVIDKKYFALSLRISTLYQKIN
jgi:hypothetical protein